MLEAILLTIATAATPLLIAALGELVVERSGVLNLGVEGMMVMGAVTGFGVGTGHRLALARRRWPRIVAGALFSLLFGFLTLTLVTNQVATGLALTLLGLGLSGMIGDGFVGQPGVTAAAISTSRPDRHSAGRQAFCSARIRSSTCRSSLVFGVAWFLFRTRAGLTLRAVGDNHGSAHALGYPRHRQSAISR